MMMFPKKASRTQEISVEEYRKMVENGAIKFPKKSKMQPGKSKTMKAEVPEAALQKYANDAIELKRWDYIRFDNWFMTWMKLNAPAHVQAHFFSQVGGKLPDNLILVHLGKGHFLGTKLELKTQDKKGRAVGKLHGRQKHFALTEDWPIARSPEQINAVLEEIEKLEGKIREIMK